MLVRDSKGFANLLLRGPRYDSAPHARLWLRQCAKVAGTVPTSSSSLLQWHANTLRWRRRASGLRQHRKTCPPLSTARIYDRAKKQGDPRRRTSLTVPLIKTIGGTKRSAPAATDDRDSEAVKHSGSGSEYEDDEAMAPSSICSLRLPMPASHLAATEAAQRHHLPRRERVPILWLKQLQPPSTLPRLTTIPTSRTRTFLSFGTSRGRSVPSPPLLTPRAETS